MNHDDCVINRRITKFSLSVPLMVPRVCSSTSASCQKNATVSCHRLVPSSLAATSDEDENMAAASDENVEAESNCDAAAPRRKHLNYICKNRNKSQKNTSLRFQKKISLFFSRTMATTMALCRIPTFSELMDVADAF